MSLDTYLSLLIGDITAFLGSVYLAIIQTKRNKIGRQQLKKFYALITITIIIAIGLTIFYVVSTRNEKKAEYDNQSESGYFDLNNQNYLEAAEHYHQAALNSYNQDTFLKAAYSEGMCYLLYAIIHDDIDYYQNASEIYTQIIKNEEYVSSEYYVDSVSDLSSIYYLLGYSWDHPEWKELIESLEKTLILKPVENISTYSELSLSLKVFHTLGQYYERAVYSSFDNYMSSELSLKALQYYTKYSQLYSQNMKLKGELSSLNSQTYNVIKIADFLYIYGNLSDDREEYFQSALELCRTEMDRINHSNCSLTNYISLKVSIGKGLLLLSFVDENRKEQYLQESYQEILPLIYITDSDVETELISAGAGLVRTNLCSEEDLARVMEIYEKTRLQISPADDPAEYVSLLLSGCDTTKWIIENYDPDIYNSTSVFSAGLRYSEELSCQLSGYLNDENLKRAEEYYSFFAQYKSH